ncbi:gp099 [Rhodococcus phage ReqiPepy6]|uniref:Gp099 n=1 Tax=Rhodococcus phage ReqiPepy6 TaxID=691965 RepID=D4P7L0_9CAUD|nr:gp099 [Rhodococcus phage ReqiPepy6]ADD80990.1 gp099 [Rhodococcus phage ReqiPepy6]
MNNDTIAAELGRSLSEIRNTLLKEFTKMAAPEGTFDEVSTHSMLVEYIEICRQYREEAATKIEMLIQEDLKHPRLKPELVVPEVVDARESLNAIVVSCGGEVIEDENLRRLAQRAADLSRNRARVMSNNEVEKVNEHMMWTYVAALENVLGIYTLRPTLDSRKQAIIDKLAGTSRIDVLDRVLETLGGTPDPNEDKAALKARVTRMTREALGMTNGIETNLSYSDGYKASEEIRKSLVGILEAAGKTVEPDESLFYISGRVQELVGQLTKCISTPSLEAIENGLKKIIQDAGVTVRDDASLVELAARVQALVEKTH